jgi:hypothetical protein
LNLNTLQKEPYVLGSIKEPRYKASSTAGVYTYRQPRSTSAFTERRIISGSTSPLKTNLRSVPAFNSDAGQGVLATSAPDTHADLRSNVSAQEKYPKRFPLSTIFCERCLRISFSSLPVDTGGREGVGYNETSSARCPFCLTRTGPLINTMFCKRCQRDRKRCRHSHMRVSGFSTCAFHTKLGSHLVTLIVQLVAFRMRRAVHSPNHHVFSLALSSRRIVVRIVCRVFVCTGGLPHVSRRPQLQPSCVPPCSLIAPRCRSSFLPRFPCTRWRARR